ncbi:MAG TPA: hypothetical protein VLA56_17485 [Pseudomonadales bacterium]|nr:hypothetical protein [Pseudomonadales bacterium]
MRPRVFLRPSRLLSSVLALAALVAPPAFAGEAFAGVCEELGGARATAPDVLENLSARAAPELEGTPHIGRILVRRQQIFDPTDPKEDNPLYRLANDLHLVSREQAVTELLPFVVGDAYDAEKLHEAERILRRSRAFYDARVMPVQRCGDAVDVAVVTRDVWSIVPTGDVNRSGGESSYAVGVKDVNLFGRNETLGAYFESGVDRDGVTAFYEDPALLGSRWTLGLVGADNSDGGRAVVDLRKPYRALDDRDTAGFLALYDERVQPLFDTGLRVAEFQQRTVTAQAFMGRSTGRVDGNVTRFSWGIAHFDHEFDREPGLLQPVQLADDRQATYPFVAMELLEDEWGATNNLDIIQITEDVYLGRRITASLGASPDALGADDGRVLFSASLEDTAQPAEDWLLIWSAAVDGVVTTSDGEAENLIAELGGRAYYRQNDSFALFGSLDGTWTNGLTRDRQLLLGGDNGLRGYPQRFQDGDRRLRMRLEQRWFSGAHPFQLFRFGAALFLDAGRSWFDDDPDDDESGWLANVGVGLRISSTRFPTNSMVHIDFAVPLRTGGRDVDSVQVSLTLKETF